MKQKKTLKKIKVDKIFNLNRIKKYESIKESKVQLNEDTLSPLIDDMLKSRYYSIKQINELFNSNVTIELTDSLKKKRRIN